MSNVEHAPDATPNCPRNTPWCVRHESRGGLNHCWTADYDVHGYSLAATNGTTTGEIKVYGLDDGPGPLTFADIADITAVVNELRALTSTPTSAAPEQAAPATTVHQPWCVIHDPEGGFCWSEVVIVAGVDLQLENSTGTTRVFGLNDSRLPDAMSLEDTALLASTLQRLHAQAAQNVDTTPTCSRYSWCASAADDDHNIQCASLEYRVRDLHGELWVMYLRSPADTVDLVEVCVDGRAHGVPMSGAAVAHHALAAVSALHHDREAMLGLFQAVETVGGYEMVLDLLQLDAAGRKDVA